ncbi:hypothetical protein F5887DRAFT_921889 [Amanita rubescens]|nr:hypothetical protein F5887DRAFT_921889 [Amanita rubescens]
MSKSSGKPTAALDSLFPTPSPPPSLVAPTRWAGITPQTVQVLKKVLKDNYERWHIFFNDRGFHNHAVHRILALWALGADEAIIEVGYETDSSYLRETYPSPNPITVGNFKEHLGDANAYLEFFSREVLDLGLPGALEKYIFSREFNFSKDGEPLRMLDRFISGLLHPFIHTGYGYEFGLPGIVAEGLAQTALHETNFRDVINAEFFNKYAGNTAALKVKPTHALTILSRVLKDERLAGAPEHLSQQSDLTATVSKYADIICEYVEQWDTETADPNNTTRKFEELVWTNVAIYGTSGFKQGAEFKNDFAFMHLVTSAIFLPSVLSFLSPPSQDLLLRVYFASTLAFYVIRGRPSLNIKSFYEYQETVYPLPGGALPTPHETALPRAAADPNRVKAVTPNPWLPIIATSLVHPNEHLVKLQRALAQFNTLFGARGQGGKEGGLEGATQEMKDAELLDGTLFIRVAGLTAKKMGRVREGEVNGDWDFTGLRRN